MDFGEQHSYFEEHKHEDHSSLRHLTSQQKFGPRESLGFDAEEESVIIDYPRTMGHDDLLIVKVGSEPLGSEKATSKEFTLMPQEKSKFLQKSQKP